MREFDEAIVQYRNVLQLDAGSAVSYNNLGLCYYHKNRFVAVSTIFMFSSLVSLRMCQHSNGCCNSRELALNENKRFG